MKKLSRTLVSIITAFIMVIPCFTFTGFANVITDELAPIVLKGAMNYEARIDITDIVTRNRWSLDDTVDKLTEAYLANPELFFVSNKIKAGESGKKYYVEFTYTMSAEEQQAAWDKIDAVCKKIMSGITSDMTDLEKILYVHDYLILNCKYDYNKKNFDMYDCLVSRSAVCQGYSLAYMYILNKYLGIECTIAYSDPIDHAWNYVKLNGNWYHVDVTKDDPATTYKDSSYDNFGYVMHENFLMSDDLCRRTTEPHKSWKIIGDYPAATDKSYDNAFWRNADSPIVMNGKTAYYALMNEKEGAIDICLHNFSEGTDKAFLRIKNKWYLRRDQQTYETYPFGKYYYRQSWMSLALRNGKLYFNTSKSVYYYDLTTKKTKKLYTLNKGDQQIFGMMFTSADMLRLAYRYDVTYPENYLSLRLK